LRRFFLKATTLGARSCATISAANRSARKQRRTDLGARQKDLGERNSSARLAGEAIDLQHVAGRDPILLAAGADDANMEIPLQPNMKTAETGGFAEGGQYSHGLFTVNPCKRPLASTKRGVYAA